MNYYAIYEKSNEKVKVNCTPNLLFPHLKPNEIADRIRENSFSGHRLIAIEEVAHVKTYVDYLADKLETITEVPLNPLRYIIEDKGAESSDESSQLFENIYGVYGSLIKELPIQKQYSLYTRGGTWLRRKGENIGALLIKLLKNKELPDYLVIRSLNKAYNASTFDEELIKINLKKWKHCINYM